MKEAFLLPLASRPYDPNKRVYMTNELNIIATRLVSIKMFKDLNNEATSAATSAFDRAQATEAHVEAERHEMDENAREAQHNKLFNMWNGLTDAEKLVKAAPPHFVHLQFAQRVIPVDEKETRTDELRRLNLAQHLTYALSTAAAIGQMYVPAETANAAKRLSLGHETALAAAIPAIAETLRNTAKIQAHSAAIVVMVDTVFEFWAIVVQKNDAGKLASATITANQAILARPIKATAALDNLTDHCEAFENVHKRTMIGFADLLAGSVLTALEPALHDHVKTTVGRDKLTSWAAQPQNVFVKKLGEQANLFLAGQPAATGPALAALQVEVAALRIENKRLADHQRQQQRVQPAAQPAQQQQRAQQSTQPAQQQQPTQSVQQQQQRQQQLRVSHPPGHPQYTGCAVRDLNGRRCGAMDHGWRDHPI